MRIRDIGHEEALCGFFVYMKWMPDL